MSVNDVNTTSTSEGVCHMYMYTYVYTVLHHTHNYSGYRYMCVYCNSCCIPYKAGNIGREFNLVVWRMSGRSAKYSANGDFADLILYATAAVPDPAHAEITVPRSAKLKSASLPKN